MNRVSARDFQIRDSEELRNLALECWKFTYGNIYSSETIAAYVESFYSDEQLVRSFAMVAAGPAKFTVLEDQAGKIVGYQNSTISDSTPELRRIYVHPVRVGTGLGKLLLRDSETFFVENHFTEYQVMVHKDNELGMNFYRRNGFKDVELIDDEMLMKKQL